jgi:multiple antibiotic resistance protein
MKLWTGLDFDFAFVAFSSLFSIINPISTAPIFVAMTAGGIDRRKTAWRTSISAGITLAIFAAMGGAIFAFFGITVPAFQIAGGILFTLISVQTLMNGKEEIPEDEAGADPSIVPLGIPMIAGPGAISTVMVLIGQAQDGFRVFALGAAILVNIILTLLILLASPWIVKRLGVTGQKITAKVMGLITLVIGVQFVINGSASVFTDILKSVRT